MLLYFQIGTCVCGRVGIVFITVATRLQILGWTVLSHGSIKFVIDGYQESSLGQDGHSALN